MPLVMSIEMDDFFPSLHAFHQVSEIWTSSLLNKQKQNQYSLEFEKLCKGITVTERSNFILIIDAIFLD